MAYAVYPRGQAPAVLQGLAATATWTHALPHGFEGAVFTVSAEGWTTPLGETLKKDPIDG